MANIVRIAPKTWEQSGIKLMKKRERSIILTKGESTMRNFARITSTLLATALCTSAAFATTYSQKTYLATRPAGVNLAMEYTTWNDHAYRSNKGREHKVHSHLQATGFYQDSTNGKDLGKYFGIGNGKNSFQVGDQAAIEAGTSEVDGRFLIHRADTGDNIVNLGTTAPHKLAGLVSFNPRQELWGVRFDYFQDICHGLFLKANLPVVNVSNDMRMRICNSVPQTVDDDDAATTTFSLQDFFAGRVNVDAATDPVNQQSPLTKAKICGKRSATGVADIDLALGYKVWDQEESHVYLNLGVAIPTGRKPNGVYVFEPVYGNGGHVGFGAGLDAGVEFWHAKKCSARVLFAANYRYLFEGDETRTLGVANGSCNTPCPTPCGSTSSSSGTGNFPWDVKSPAQPTTALITPRPPKLLQYYLVAADQQQNKPLQPAANILTRRVDVTPGSQLDGIVDLNFKCSGFIADLGYNLFWKEREKVCAKSLSCQTACDGTSLDVNYGFAHPHYSTADLFNDQKTVSVETTPIDGKFINANLSTAPATTPSTLTNKIFAGLGYGFEISDKYPTSVGVGGSYEFASNNAAIEAWSVWLKACISF